jgi:hypothetical protein
MRRARRRECGLFMGMQELLNNLDLFLCSFRITEVPEKVVLWK